MQAFPFQHKDPTTGLTNISVGMTMRDYFAAIAMQALIREGNGTFDIDDIVRSSWVFADQMMIVRQQ